jgi:hypothetical protein
MRVRCEEANATKTFTQSRKWIIDNSMKEQIVCHEEGEGEERITFFMQKKNRKRGKNFLIVFKKKRFRRKISKNPYDLKDL